MTSMYSQRVAIKPWRESPYPGLLAVVGIGCVGWHLTAVLIQLVIFQPTSLSAHGCGLLGHLTACLLIACLYYQRQSAHGLTEYFCLQPLPGPARRCLPSLCLHFFLLTFALRELFLQTLLLTGIPYESLSGPPSDYDWFHPISIVGTVFTAPFGEELIFRALFLQGLLVRFSRTRSIVLTALLFGIFHWNFHQALSGFITGIFLGRMFVDTRSLWVPITMHGIHNSLLLVLVLLIDQIETWGGSLPSPLVTAFGDDGWLPAVLVRYAFFLAIATLSWLRFKASHRNLLLALSAAHPSPPRPTIPPVPRTFDLREFKVRRPARRPDTL